MTNEELIAALATERAAREKAEASLGAIIEAARDMLGNKFIAWDGNCDEREPFVIAHRAFEALIDDANPGSALLVELHMRRSQAAGLLDDVREAVAAREKAEAALVKIDAIRNSIVGRQSIHWSMHIYPLVEALGEAGYEGEGYEVARSKAKAEVAGLEAIFGVETAEQRVRAEKAEAALAECRRLLHAKE